MSIKKICMTRSSIATFPKQLLSYCILARKIALSACIEMPLMDSASWNVLGICSRILTSTNGTIVRCAMGSVRGEKKNEYKHEMLLKSSQTKVSKNFVAFSSYTLCTCYVQPGLLLKK